MAAASLRLLDLEEACRAVIHLANLLDKSQDSVEVARSPHVL